MTSTHRAQHPVAAGLRGQVDPLAEIVVLINRRHDVRMEVAWKRSGEFYALHFGGGHRPQQATEWGGALDFFQTTLSPGTITIHILTNQMNLSVPVAAKFVYLRDNVGSLPALFPAARVRHDAVSTKLVAAFDNRNEGDIFRGPGGRRDVPHVAG